MRNKKVVATLLVAAMTMSMMTGCKGGDTVPEISGVSDQSVQAGQEFDAMSGVKADDKEDGDITSKVSIESTPSLEFVNGKVTPDKAGDYELAYIVKDKDGNEATAYATLTVTKQTGDAAIYHDLDFNKAAQADVHGWTANIAEGVDATAAVEKGAYVFHINAPGNGDGDIQLVKQNVEIKKANYQVKVWAKATAKTYCHLLAVDANATEWKSFGGAYNVVIGEEIAPIEMNFSVENDGKANLLLNLGKITPNPENPSDTTPENFEVVIDKVEIYEITGNETKEEVYSCDFSKDTSSVTVEAGDGATASVTGSTFKIDSYPTEGGVWSIKANIGIGNNAIEAGSKYYYSFDVTAKNNQSGECLVESATEYDKARANFAGLSLQAGETVKVEGVFVAENNVTDPVIRLQIGNPSEGVTNNEITIDNVSFGKVTGDLAKNKTIDSFKGIEPSADFPCTTYNGTDEDNDRGVGTIYTENGSFFYRIDQGGVTDWHNKLIIGTRENPLVLESDSYYTVEITCKADKNVSCSFFLNPIGNWDPRLAEGMEITTEEQTFTFTTTDTLITDMDFEMLMQFGSEATASLGDVTIEFTDINIYQQKVVD